MFVSQGAAQRCNSHGNDPEVIVVVKCSSTFYNELFDTTNKPAMRCFTILPEEFFGKIPFIVSNLIEQLRERHCNRVEGIFRLNGNDAQIKALTEKLDKGPVTDWAAFGDIHTITTTLKRYFSTMATQEPLLTFAKYDHIVNVMRLETYEKQLSALRKLVNSLPVVRRKTLSYLCQFLHELSLDARETKMSAENLAICFAQSVIAAPVGKQIGLNDCKHTNGAFGLMIADYDYIFRDAHTTEKDLCTPQDLEIIMQPMAPDATIQQLVKRLKVQIVFEDMKIQMGNNGAVSKIAQPPKWRRSEDWRKSLLFNQGVEDEKKEEEGEDSTRELFVIGGVGL